MKNLFGQIRNKMINTRRVGNYLLYALGEIILIVIGIFVAVQLNNLNEESKNKRLEINYLHGIIENLNQDIGSLISHARIQTYKLDVYTILINAFSDENIRSDRHLLKHASMEAYGYYDFDPYRNIFDGMRSAGKINLIRSADMLNAIQQYYVQSEAVVKTEALYNAQIIEHQREIFTHMININSLSEDIFELQRQSKLIVDDLSFFHREISDDEVKEFVNRITDIKKFTRTIIRRENSLRSTAEELKTRIIEYLGETEEEKYSNSLVEFSSPDFIPSIPRNIKPVDNEELGDYLGTYELIQSNNSSGPYGEEDRIIITLENNHLVVYNMADRDSHSYYCVDKDEFRRATSFLFDDPKSRSQMNFTRDENQKIIDVTISEYVEDIFKYVKIETR